MFREPNFHDQEPPNLSGSSPATSGVSMRGLWQRLRPLPKPYRLALSGAMLALVISSGTVLAIGQGLRILVDQGFALGSQVLLDRALLFLLAAVLILAGATYARSYCAARLGEMAAADIRQAVYSGLLRQELAYFENTKAGELLACLTSDITLVQVMIGSCASIALRNLLLLLGGFTMLLVTSTSLMAWGLLVILLALVPIITLGRLVRGRSKHNQDVLASATAKAEETISFISTVLAYTRENFEREQFRERIKESLTVGLGRIRAQASLNAVVITLVFGAVGVVLWIGGREVIAGQLSAGSLAAFVLYAVICAGALGALSEIVGELFRAIGAGERVLELFDRNPSISTPAYPAVWTDPVVGTVEFDQVEFRYPSPEGALPEGGLQLSLSISAGESVAIVGPSGAGKSTLFKLLLRFYDPQSGRILLDGVDIKTADLQQLRGKIGLVPQEPAIFSASAYDNIRYGRLNASPEDIQSAAQAAHVSQFMPEPLGLHRFVGEKGSKLSAGQRQRLALARVLVRNPPLLLLDEATSALDSENEHLIQDTLKRVTKGRTTLVIAHRLSTILSADRIVVLDKGQIVAVGSHHQLIQQDGLYARLAALQFNPDPFRSAKAHLPTVAEDKAIHRHNTGQ